MRFHIKINCEGHKYTYECPFHHSCVTPIREFYLEPPLIVKWNSIEWAIFPPPCWDAANKVQCVNALEQAIGIEIIKTDGKNASPYIINVHNLKAKIILETGFSNKYRFTWEWLENDLCEVCNKSAITIKESNHWKDLDLTRKDIFAYAWSIENVDIASFHWVTKKIIELKPSIKEHLYFKKLTIRVCSDSCAVETIGTIHNVCKQAVQELKKWQHNKKQQQLNVRQIKESKKLMIRLRKSVMENDHEALKLLQKELEQVATLQE